LLSVKKCYNFSTIFIPSTIFKSDINGIRVKLAKDKEKGEKERILQNQLFKNSFDLILAIKKIILYKRIKIEPVCANQSISTRSKNQSLNYIHSKKSLFVKKNNWIEIFFKL